MRCGWSDGWWKSRNETQECMGLTWCNWREREFSLKFRQTASFFLTFIPTIWLITFFLHVVYHQDKDQYGNEVQKLARPLPVEYLLVDLPTSSPLIPLHTFPAHEHPFPVENRLIDGHLQDFGSLHNYMQRFRSQDYLTVGWSLHSDEWTKNNDWFDSQSMTNFHLLYYLYGLDCFGTKMKTQMTPLLEAVRTQDTKMAEQFMKGDTWSTLEHLIGAHSGQEWVE